VGAFLVLEGPLLYDDIAAEVIRKALDAPIEERERPSLPKLTPVEQLAPTRLKPAPPQPKKKLKVPR
jgi:hypothetical protein